MLSLRVAAAALQSLQVVVVEEEQTFPFVGLHNTWSEPCIYIPFFFPTLVVPVSSFYNVLMLGLDVGILCFSPSWDVASLMIS